MGHDYATATRAAAGVDVVDGATYIGMSTSGSIIACCPQVRKSGHDTQSVAILAGSHVCGTMEKF
jgi:hypothetical protein